MPELPNKTILVTGDCHWDHHLKFAESTARYEAPAEAELSAKASGAWGLASLVGKTCGGAKVYAPNEFQDASRDFLKWSLFKSRLGESDRVWRAAMLGREMVKTPAYEIASEPASPDLLVIDDLNLGFRNRQELWPKCLTDRKNQPTSVLCRVSAPLGGNALWNVLLNNWADRLTVVLNASVLRSRNAAIPRLVSWDTTIEKLLAEFGSGPSSKDLATCREVVVHFGASGAAVLRKNKLLRFVYDPNEVEGTWESKRPGDVYHVTSTLTAMVARRLIEPETSPLFITLDRALSAIRAQHENGAGAEDKFSLEHLTDSVAQILTPASPWSFSGRFHTAFPSGLLDDEALKRNAAHRSSLLTDFTGFGHEYVLAHAIDVAVRGLDEAMGPVPKGCFGKYLTVEREEIDRLHAIRGAMLLYRDNAAEDRPLSIGVFGPPGSGKSFAIREITKEIFGDQMAFLQFNLSQFEEVRDLHNAFHRIRDASLKGKIPVAFWDEFDTDDLKWLKHFLAPMQDGEFRSEGEPHPFGKSIFIFAGGTRYVFEKFADKTNARDRKDFQAAKGPDFVSRLRGHVNIQGLNAPEANERAGDPGHDSAYLIRRALIFRSKVEKYAPHLLKGPKKEAAISFSVARAFLTVRRFKHGARSLDSVVSLCRLSGAQRFRVADVPTADLLAPHVSDDFSERLEDAALTEELLEALSKAGHEAWLQDRKNKKLTDNPYMKPYDQLSDAEKEMNRRPARLTIAKLRDIGYRVAPKEKAGKRTIAKLTPTELKRLAILEHDVWLRERLLNGYECGERNNQLRVHPNVARFAELPKSDQDYDRVIVASIFPTLTKLGYVLVPAADPTTQLRHLRNQRR